MGLGAPTVSLRNDVFPGTSPVLRYMVFLSDAPAAGSEMTMSQKVFKTWFLLILI